MPTKPKNRTFWPLFFMVLSVLFFIWLFSSEDKLTKLSSEFMKKQISSTGELAVVNYIDTHFNYSKNGLPYKSTFIEFGSTTCRACKEMEEVMIEIKKNYHKEVNVVFVDISNKQNQSLIRYYGVSLVPMQVFLDSVGDEYFRHTGFISTDSISNILH